MFVLLFKDFFEISELEYEKCSKSKNNRVLLARIKEANMFLRSDQLTNVALITQNNSLTSIFFNQVKEQAQNVIVRNSTRSERRVQLILTERNFNIYLLFRQTKDYFRVHLLPPNQNTCTRNERMSVNIFSVFLCTLLMQSQRVSRQQFKDREVKDVNVK